MPDTIRDGKGRGYLGAVNSNNQLVTRATVVEQRLKSAVDENYYEVTTGQVTLTDAVETGLIYISTTDTDKVLVIDRVFFDTWESTSGTGGGILKYYINPTVTGGTAVTPTNTNFSSNSTPSVTVKKSVTSIDTGDVWWTGYLGAGSGVALEEGRIVLPAGSSFAISAAAPASNTSMKISINVAFYMLDTELLD